VHRLSASTVWYAYEAVASFLWATVFTVTAYYFVTEVGMSPLELVLVGTVMELSIFVFEVPTGIVADTTSRRLSIVIGVIMGVAFVVVGVFPDVWPILVGYALWGLGYTFTSGAMDAWLADEVGDERLTRVYLRGAQVGRAFTIVGTAAGVGLALVDIRLPIVLGGLGTIVLAAFYAGWMPETGFRPASREGRSSFRHMAETGRSGARLVRSRPALLAILGVAAFAGMWSESYDRLWQAHLIEDVGLPSLGGLDPVVWFGILGVVGTLLSIAVAAPLEKRLEDAPVAGIARTLTVLYAILGVSSLVFALAGSLWLAVIGSYGVVVARQVGGPLFMSWLNRSIDDSGVRATTLSIVIRPTPSGSGPAGRRSARSGR
jgi:MFS transporter, DHA3 family, tetracycline resistance protein